MYVSSYKAECSTGGEALSTCSHIVVRMESAISKETLCLFSEMILLLIKM